MNSRLYIFSASLMLCCGLSYYAVAQDEVDALRYSRQTVMGTARSMGIGGALGSVGGDFSSLSVNPAGIGIYRSSEFMFTPSIKLGNVKSTYIGNSTSDNATRFNFNNIGVVLTGTANGKRYQRSKWKSVSFGIGINRIADFTRNYTYAGDNNTSSLSEIFAADASAYPQDINNISTLAGIGYQGYLIEGDTNNNFYTIAPYADGLRQRRSVQERGGMHDIVISLGGNYMEKLMLGVTLGIPTLNYNRETTYEERDLSGNNNNDFDNFVYQNTLNTTGVGVNLKLGFIYKPVNEFRFGIALHTPTYYGMTDIYNRSLSSNTEGYKAAIGSSDINPITVLQSGVDIPEQTFDYGITTPFKAVISAAGFMNKFGFITADVEYVDYSTTRYNFGSGYGAYQSTINDAIRNSYKGAANVRLGAEGRFDMLMVRLGFGYNGNPYKNGSVERMDYSGGLGFRFSDWYMDFGFVHSEYEESEQPYVLVYPKLGEIPVPKAVLKNSLNNVAITVGFKF
jgi:hypothetical protein